MEGEKHPAQDSAGLPLGSVQHIELGDDVPVLRGQAAHQVLQPDGCYCFFLRGWASRGKLLVCLQQPLIGILPAGGKGDGLRLLVTGNLLCFQVVGEVFLFAPVVVISPVDLLTDGNRLPIYVEIIFLLFFAYGVTSKVGKIKCSSSRMAPHGSGAISRRFPK